MLKKYIALMVSIIVTSSLLLSACVAKVAPAESYVKSIGGNGTDEFLSIYQTSDGGIIAAGYSSSDNGDIPGNKGGSDALLAQFDNNGKVQWVKNFGGSKSENFTCVQQTTEGGFIALGNSNSNDGDLPGNKGDYDAVLVLFDSSGKVKWVKNFGGSKFDDLKFVQQTSDGGFIAAGYSYSTDGDLSGLGNSGYDAILARFDSSGKVQWVTVFGGSKPEVFTAVQQTSDGGYIAVGSSESKDDNLLGNKGEGDAILVWFDSNGKFQRVKNFGGSKYEEFTSIQQTSDGGFVAVGSSDSSDGDFAELNNMGYTDAILARFDSRGEVQWVKNIGGSKPDRFDSVGLTSDGGFIAAGSSDSSDGNLSGNKGRGDAILAEFSSNGKLQWVDNIGGSDAEMFKSVQQVSDGGFVAAGFSGSIDGDFCVKMGNFDAVVVKYVLGSSLPKQSLVIDKEPPIIQVIVEKSGDTVVNGGYASNWVKVTVSDAHPKIKSINRNGIPQTWTGTGVFTEKGFYEIDASDMLGNTARYTFTIK